MGAARARGALCEAPGNRWPPGVNRKYPRALVTHHAVTHVVRLATRAPEAVVQPLGYRVIHGRSLVGTARDRHKATGTAQQQQQQLVQQRQQQQQLVVVAVLRYRANLFAISHVCVC